jgi:hypothetical protein
LESRHCVEIELTSGSSQNNSNIEHEINFPQVSWRAHRYVNHATNRLKIAVEGAPVPGSLTCPATSSWCREYNYDHFGGRGQLPGFGQAYSGWLKQRLPKPGNCPPAQSPCANSTMHMAVPTSQSAFYAGNNRLRRNGSAAYNKFG